MSHNYLLLKGGLYWRPNSQGYTGLKSEAGRYDYFSAKERERPDCGGSVGVSMIPENLAPHYAPGCSLETRVFDMEKRLEKLEKIELLKKFLEVYHDLPDGAFDV